MKRELITIILSACAYNYAFSITPSELTSVILSNNIDFKEAELIESTERGVLNSNNNLPDPEVEMEYLFGEQKDSGTKLNLGISQGFDWPGLYHSRNVSNKLRSEALTYLTLSKYLEIRLEIRLMINNLISINKRIDLQRALQSNLNNLSDKYYKGFDHGEISILDINKLKLETLSINFQLDKLLNERNQLISELEVLNGNNKLAINDLNSLNDYTNIEPKNIDYYLQSLVENDPEYKYFDTSSKASKNDIKTQKMSWAPSFSLGYRYSNEQSEKFNGFTAGVSIPIFSNRNKSKIATSQYLNDVLKKESILGNKELLFRSYYNQIYALSKQISDYNAILKDDSSIKILKKALDGGEISLITFLQETKYFIEAKNILIDLESQYNDIYCKLNKYN